MKQNIGNKIRELREGRDLTPNDLAEKTRVSLATVYNWEQGKTLPASELLPVLASVLNTTIDNIMMYSNKEQIKKSISRYYFDLDLDEYEKAMDLVKLSDEAKPDDEMEFRLISIEMTHLLHQSHNLITRIDELINEVSDIDQEKMFQIHNKRILLQILYYGTYDVLDELKSKADLNPTLQSFHNLVFGYLVTGQSNSALQLCEEVQRNFQSRNLDVLLAECQWRSGKIDLACEILWKIQKSRNEYPSLVVIIAHEMLYRILLKKMDTKRITELMTYSIDWLPEEFSKNGYDSQQARRKFENRLKRFASQ
jgi:transcriptional regulator with XRE-family HTH domain